MKKLVIVLVVFIGVQVALSAQNTRSERIEALRIAFITNKLNLTSEESQNFWPIYNDYKASVAKVRREYKDDRDPQLMSDSEVEDYLDKSMELEQRLLGMKEGFINDLRKVISVRKIVRLKQAESEFKRKLLSEQKKRRMQRGNAGKSGNQ